MILKSLNTLEGKCGTKSGKMCFFIGLAPGTAHHVVSVTREYDAEDSNKIKLFYMVIQVNI